MKDVDKMRLTDALEQLVRTLRPDHEETGAVASQTDAADASEGAVVATGAENVPVGVAAGEAEGAGEAIPGVAAPGTAIERVLSAETPAADPAEPTVPGETAAAGAAPPTPRASSEGDVPSAPAESGTGAGPLHAVRQIVGGVLRVPAGLSMPKGEANVADADPSESGTPDLSPAPASEEGAPQPDLAAAPESPSSEPSASVAGGEEPPVSAAEGPAAAGPEGLVDGPAASGPGRGCGGRPG